MSLAGQGSKQSGIQVSSFFVIKSADIESGTALGICYFGILRTERSLGSIFELPTDYPNWPMKVVLEGHRLFQPPEWFQETINSDTSSPPFE